MRTLALAAGLLVLPLGGCLAKTAYNVATLPVKAGGRVVDWTTTSQAEADRNYGRRMRQAEEREGRERRDWAKRCRHESSDPDCRGYTGYRADRAR